MENKKLENLTSKNKKIFGVYTRDWKPGDFVKVMNYDITGLPSPYYGIIIGPLGPEDPQTKIFPSYRVYALDMRREEKVEVYNLDLISAAE